MAISTLQEQLEADVSILLMRALMSKTVSAFGDDGLGKHGRNDRAHFFTIEDMAIDVDFDEDTGAISGGVSIALEKYSAKTFGHICTDQNFLISVSEHLRQDEIDPNCLTYGGVSAQGENYVFMNIDVERLLDWP